MLKKDLMKVAKRIYDSLGAGHEEVIYREAMSIELQELGYTVKTEMPISIKYGTSKGKEIIIGSVKADLFISKKNETAVIELKATSSLMKKDGTTKPREKMKEYAQLQKYLSALGENNGFLVNFPFPPMDTVEPEIVEFNIDE